MDSDEFKKKFSESFIKSINNEDLYPISNIKINEILSNNKNFIGCFSHDQLPFLNPMQSCIINFATSEKIGTHWIALKRLNNNILLYFDSYGVKYISDRIKRFYKNLIMVSNIYRMQRDTSKLCGAYCMLFVNYPMENVYDYQKYLLMFKPIQI